MTPHVNINISGNKASDGAIQANSVTIGAPSEYEIHRACLKALRCPDSFKVKTRLKQTKDELLQDCFRWILSDEQYRQWQDGDDISLLWIKGGAGKGKTMMSIGLVEELLRHQGRSIVVAYFFCQNADSSLNTIEAILKGLILRLVEQREMLYKALTKRWDTQRACFEEDVGLFGTLWDIFLEMLSQCQSCGDTVFIVVDALDECLRDGMSDFLQGLVRTGLSSPGQLKWLLTSRPLQEAEDFLVASSNRVHISFELNLERIAAAVRTYVEEQVRKLAVRKRIETLQHRAIVDAIHVRANGTFLWASFVCKELQDVSTELIMSIITSTSSKLRDLYAKAYANYYVNSPEIGTWCADMLQVLMLAYRPLTMPELAGILDFPDDNARIRALINRCSMFLTIRDEDGIEFVEFVHQSARDYLAGLSNFSSSDQISPYSHEVVASRCLSILTGLHANPFRCTDVAATVNNITASGVRPLAGLRYAALHWASHLEPISDRWGSDVMLRENGQVHVFLRTYFLEWLECLSLMDQLPRAGEVLDQILKRFSTIEATNNPELARYHHTDQARSVLPRRGTKENASALALLVRDERRFLARHFRMIAEWPLQVYISAMVFSPKLSIVRQNNRRRVPRWLQRFSETEIKWSPLQQTLTGHSEGVKSVAFSPDGQLVASGSWDKTVKLWSVQTGRVQQTFTGHSDEIISVAFSPDSQLVASSSGDKTVKLWSVQSGQVQRTLVGHLYRVVSIAFSPDDGQLIASGSADNTVKLWSVQTGRAQQTFTGHSDGINWIAFSPDGQLIASGSADNTVKLWSVQTGRAQRTLIGHSDGINWIAFSPDGQLIASGSDDKTVKLWSVQTGRAQRTLIGHLDGVKSVAFSPDGQLVASGSWDKMVKLWSAQTGRAQRTLIGHSDGINWIAFSPDGQLVASGSWDKTVKLWSVQTGRVQQTFTGHLGGVKSVAFSPDGQLIASGSDDKTVKLWLIKTEQVQGIPTDHSNGVWSVAFSPDGQLVASGSDDETVKLWSVKTGRVQRTLIGHLDGVWSVAFSPDGQLVASGSGDKTIKLWSVQTGRVQQTFTGHLDGVNSVAFSPDGQLIASGSDDKTVKLWSVPPFSSHENSIAGMFRLRTKWRTIQTFRCDDAIWGHHFTWDGGKPILSSGSFPISSTMITIKTVPQSIDTDRFFLETQWIACGLMPLLYVPSEYKVACFASQDDAITIGCQNGQVLFFRIDCAMVFTTNEGDVATKYVKSGGESTECG